MTAVQKMLRKISFKGTGVKRMILESEKHHEPNNDNEINSGKKYICQ